MSQSTHLSICNGTRIEAVGLQILPADGGNRKEIIFQPLQESLLFWCYRGLCLEIRPQVI
ncbi:hypothetical protein AAH032_23300 [Bacteroides thetaiotaomicron]|uniref:hypothetical protein n=1 Tax=Bacteroides thetaiotaomicron TaxID=818 RepID=UPI0039B60537